MDLIGREGCRQVELKCRELPTKFGAPPGVKFPSHGVLQLLARVLVSYFKLAAWQAELFEAMAGRLEGNRHFAHWLASMQT